MVRTTFLRRRLRAAIGSCALVAVPVFGTMACSSEAPEQGDATHAIGTSGQKVHANSAAATAPDPTEVGPLAVSSAEYQFPAEIDPDILPDQKTELWARVYRPEKLDESAHPLLVFLHGNHSTCGTGTNPRVDNNCRYSTEGVCNPGYVVAPNHLGYAYVAERLASHGYVVVSINANRGINCSAGPAGDPFLNLSRGRLVLKHLQRLSEWNANGGTPASLGVELQGKLDFSQVGLMGHSRGGEGMRAAYNFYREANSTWPAKILSPVSFRALFEIGPVDGQLPTDPPFPLLNADGTVWSVLLPMCDGDVSTLAGIWPYDRMLRMPTETPAKPKSTFTVWGANHNFYNTEWQETDAEGEGCTGHERLWENEQSVGSEKQRTTGLASLMGFFRANVGPNADAKYNQIFNPMFELPAVVTNITRVDRGYTDSSSSSVTDVIEDFNQSVGTNSHGTPNDAAGITITHDTVPTHYHAKRNPDQKAGRISWETASAETFFQTNWTVAGEGRDIRSYKTLDIRLSRQSSALNPAEDTNFSIQLALADGSLSSPVALANYASVRGPVGGPNNNLHPILQSARIPLSDFGTVDLANVRGVRFVFDQTASGAIYLGNVRLSNVVTVPASLAPPLATMNAPIRRTNGAHMNATHTQGNAIKAIRRAELPRSAAHAAATTRNIEIELETAKSFPVRDAFPVLRIGERDFDRSSHPKGDTHRIVFTVPETDFASARNGEEITVYYDAYETSDHWVFGNLDKRSLK